ncbi:inner membrane complex protein 19 [Cystoisospora suis]|uniref:Inner membrane complex protein 19 n=1 Tax=Cystoisospora suis TaxID=483139 RepID=A0A2C6KZC0_9APIC|nr:inner membrane complex protein 19 [Cystoisospora suis]
MAAPREDQVKPSVSGADERPRRRSNCPTTTTASHSSPSVVATTFTPLVHSTPGPWGHSPRKGNKLPTLRVSGSMLSDAKLTSRSGGVEPPFSSRSTQAPPISSIGSAAGSPLMTARSVRDWFRRILESGGPPTSGQASARQFEAAPSVVHKYVSDTVVSGPGAHLPFPTDKRMPQPATLYSEIHRPPYEARTSSWGTAEPCLSKDGTPLAVLTPEQDAILVSHLVSMPQKELLGLSGTPHPMQFPHRAAVQSSYLEDFPPPDSRFINDPLLRSKLAPNDKLPYIRRQGRYGNPLNFHHNDAILDNVMISSKLQKVCPSAVPMYVDVPNFGRMQGVYAEQQDSTVYPLITLPKMAPWDIFKTLDKMEAHRRANRTRNPLRTFFCCECVESDD